MEADPGRRPEYGEYKKYISNVRSDGRLYTIADSPLVIGGYILLFAALIVLILYNPFSRSSIQYIIFDFLMIPFIGMSAYFYRKFFIYRFTRFHVRWDYGLGIKEPASDICDKYGDFLDTEENRKAAKKSRIAFLKLFAVVLAAVFLYCFLGCGLAAYRLYNWHKEQLNEMASIAEKYKTAEMYGFNGKLEVGNNDGTKTIAEGPDAEKLKQIFRSLAGESVEAIGWDGKVFYISMWTVFSSHVLLCYPGGTDISHVKADTHSENVTKLDDNWWILE